MAARVCPAGFGRFQMGGVDTHKEVPLPWSSPLAPDPWGACRSLARSTVGAACQCWVCISRVLQKNIPVGYGLGHVGWAEFKPHLRGSLEASPNQQRTASCCPPEGSWGPIPNPAPACWPTCNPGSVDTVPEPSDCTPLSLSSCDHRQAALSAAACECSLPEMSDLQKVLVPHPAQPWHQATIREAAHCLQGRTWGCRTLQTQSNIVHTLRDFGEQQQVAHGECGVG